MQENILIARNIVKQYENHLALNDVSLEIPKGSIYGLLGPNGAGKTTLMKIINQITAPDSGEIIFNNEKLVRKHISQIGYLPEERGLYRKMKVGEQSLYLAQLKGMSKKEATLKLKTWFEKLDILQWWDKKVEELSKGMAQKVQFAITVIHNPDLLIFDEPFSGFDPVNTSIIRREILELKEKGTSIIFSTHRMESVEEICDEITLIDNGISILHGKINIIKDQFRNNTFQIEVNSNNLKLDGFEIIHQDENNFTVKVPSERNSKELITEILKTSEIISFNEKIPSMEEIFIKTVSNG
ncbi:MAG: ABC transporter ATP-binding protein [Flavobacteriales bacterium]|nr:ABC transporter ATP-binding protein [Flavobacteriales bacterium]|tara:strand:- start:347 stop:1240 length:894 start_codon:yes stop_codon:yes gene_type:complete